MRALLASWAFFVVLFIAAPASAHGTRSVSIDVTEASPGRAIVHVRSSSPTGSTARPAFAAPCVTSPAAEDADA